MEKFSPAAHESDIVPIESVVLDPRNAREHPQSNLDAIKASMSAFGQMKPIVLDSTGRVIAGNGWLTVARACGWKRVWVARSDLEGDRADAYALADNRTAELAAWNLPALADAIIRLDAAGIEVGDFGWTGDQLREILAPKPNAGQVDPDDVPLPPDEAVTRRGDLWILGNHRLLCGNSGDPADLDKLLGGEPIHLAACDPPYNVKVEPRSNNAIAAGISSFSAQHTQDATSIDQQQADLQRYPGKGTATHAQLRPKDRPLANDFMSDEAFDKCLDEWFGNAARVLVEGGSFYIWGGYANCGNYPPFLKKHGLYFAQAVIWVKEHPVLTRKDFMGNHEWAFYGWKEGAAHRFFGEANIPDTWLISKAGADGAVKLGKGVRINDGKASIDITPTPEKNAKPMRTLAVPEGGLSVFTDTSPSDVWNVKKVNPQSMVHLTEKPVELAIRAIQYSSKPGENVLDIFGGSGSTLIGAEMTGRRAFLMELDELYCEVIVNRWQAFTGKTAHLDDGRSYAQVVADRAKESAAATEPKNGN